MFVYQKLQQKTVTFCDTSYFINTFEYEQRRLKMHFSSVNYWFLLTLSWRRPLSYRKQSIDLQSKSVDWLLYDNGLLQERVKHFENGYSLVTCITRSNRNRNFCKFPQNLQECTCNGILLIIKFQTWALFKNSYIADAFLWILEIYW